MNLHPLDWAIVAFFLLNVIALTLYCRRFVRSVSDFLAARRMAGRYLLTVSQGMGAAISIVALWELTYSAGLPTLWWGLLGLPVGIFLALMGFITYRFRQTRALTLAQFFEIRYSRRFRFFAGLLAWISGILNYGFYPAITARFLIYFIGIPPTLHIGSWAIATFPLVMASYLGLALFTALAGGQISIMLIDFFQGAFGLALFAILSIYLLYRFAWGDIVAGLEHVPPGHSMINPFQAGEVSDFNLGYYLIGIFASIYNAKSWQGSSGFNAAARTPHEAQMAGILSQWRSFAHQLCLLLIPLAAFAVLHLSKFAALATPIRAHIETIQDSTLRREMTVPLFLVHVLPTGFIGLFTALIISAAISCDNTTLHSWGSIFIQDVVLPLRKKPVSTRTHLLLLRVSIVGVALFGFVFSLLFSLKVFILMYFAVTSAIYLGGAGVVIIGGLYWKRGTTPAAWTALISGSTLAFGGLVLQQFWMEIWSPELRFLLPHNGWVAQHADKFPFDGQLIYLGAMLIASTLYIVISLASGREDYNMDKLLHRGAYALPEDHLSGSIKSRSWKEALGLTPEFTRRERIFFWITVGWSLGWWGIFFIGVAWNSVWGTTDAGWSWFWWAKIWFTFLLGTGISAWIIYGGMRDSVRLFRDLTRLSENEEDDGRVTAEEKKD